MKDDNHDQAGQTKKFFEINIKKTTNERKQVKGKVKENREMF